jgi:hypothetical protein
VVGGVAILRLPFIRNSGIRPVLLVLLFAFHVAVGIAHNFIAYRYYPGHGDIWDLYWNSFMFRHRLLTDFPRFLSDNSTWTLFSHNGIIFVQMILNALSNDHLDTNTLLFAFPVFLGNIALFRVFRDRFPGDPLAAFTVFLTPSVVFWTSCIHREGMLYMLVGFLLLGLHRLLTGRYTTGRLIRALLCFSLIVYFRLGFALTLVVPVFIWLYQERPRLRTWLLRAGMLALCILFLAILAPGQHIPRFFAVWQNEFYALYGHSRLPLPEMDGTWAGFFRVLPAGVLNGFFEPLPGSGGQPIYLAFSIELVMIWTITLLAFIQSIRRYPTSAIRSFHSLPTPQAVKTFPFALFCVLFALSGMLLIGLIVPFAGAIVRYRCIYLPFLLAPSLHSIASNQTVRKVNFWLSHRVLLGL